MQIGVLCSPESWYLKDLTRAAAGKHSIIPITFRQLTSSLVSGYTSISSADVDLRGLDALLVRTMPPGSLEQVVFRMDVLGQLEAAGTLVLNPSRAIEAAVDKYLASAKLSAAGLRTPRTVVCQTVDDALSALVSLGGDVVVKPLFGAEGRGITRIADEALAQRAFSLLVQLRAVLYLQEYIPHEGYDLRVFVLGDQHWCMRRSNALDWRTNVSRGAKAEGCQLDGELVDLARRAAAAVGAPIAGVDLLPGRDGNIYAIEVNAVPGWQALSRATGVNIASEVLRYTASKVTKRHKPHER
jgi:RimK family alpha-L-glutamate ligase